LSNSGPPHALDGDKWVPFEPLHSVKCLWKHLASLFHENKAVFDSIGPKDLWRFLLRRTCGSRELNVVILEACFSGIQHRDRLSKTPKKAVMTSANEDEIAKRLETSSEGPKQFMLLMKDDNNNVIGGYCYERGPLTDFNRTLQECVNLFSGLHVAMRDELCGCG